MSALSNVTLIRALDAVTDADAWSIWELEMRVTGCSARTISERKILLGNLAKYLGKPVIQASRQELMEWLARPHLSAATRQNYKSFLHTFYTLMQDEGLRVDNPTARLPRMRRPRIEANPFTTQQLQDLLRAGAYTRTRMMILLAAFQGFRATEIASTSGAHIDWEAGEILTVDAKGGVEVWRPLHPMIVEFAAAHPKVFPRDGYWFPGISERSKAAGHIPPKSVSRTLSAACRRAGIPHTGHHLRAWFATELMTSGADVLTIQAAMRHANPETLRHYIRPNMDRMQDAMRRLPSVDLDLDLETALTCAQPGCDEPRERKRTMCSRHRYAHEAAKGYYAGRRR